MLLKLVVISLSVLSLLEASEEPDEPQFQTGTIDVLMRKMEDPGFLKDLPEEKRKKLEELMKDLSGGHVPPDPSKLSATNDPEEFVKNLKKQSDSDKEASFQSADKKEPSKKKTNSNSQKLKMKATSGNQQQIRKTGDRHKSNDKPMAKKTTKKDTKASGKHDEL